MINENLRTEFDKVGIKFKTFKAEHLQEIGISMKELKEQGIMDQKLYETYLSGFQTDYNAVLENARSVIICAAYQGKSIAKFTCQGKETDSIIPPSYVYNETINRIESILDKNLIQNGYHLVKVRLPLKLVAVKSGLGQYGRNNICYVPGYGSFLRLDAYITDYEFKEDSWGDMSSMKSCETCNVCLEACPSGVIKQDRFLIYAHNCITNFNEHIEPIPEVIQPEWHNAAIGCMKCQEVCPHNKIHMDIVDKTVVFNEEETELLLNGTELSNLPSETKEKLNQVQMAEDLAVFERNISLLLQ